MRQMVEHQPAGHTQENLLRGDDLVRRRVDLTVPAHRLDPLRQRLDHVERGSAWRRQIEADAAHAGVVHLAQLLIGH
jgi:hypothetical protein